MPRSGSTILQKLISTSKSVHTSAEPWLLLPLFSMDNSFGFEPYNKKISSKAISEFDDYLKVSLNTSLDLEIAEWIKTTYGKLTPSHGYFLDKTPRYYYLQERLTKAFPEAKFIYLFRNPLEVFASKIRGHKGTLNGFFSYYDDLFQAPTSILKMKGSNESNLSISYHKLTGDHEGTTEQLQNYLALEDISYERVNSVQIHGQMGDTRAMNEHKSIELNQRNWTQCINSPIRIFIFKKLLKSCPDEFFALAGEDRRDLESNINNRKIYCLVNLPAFCFDVYHLLRSYFRTRLKSL